jgi:hypothetical protein
MKKAFAVFLFAAGIMLAREIAKDPNCCHCLCGHYGQWDCIVGTGDGQFRCGWDGDL